MELQCVSNWLFVQAMTEGSLLDYHYYGSLIIFCLHGNVVIVVIFMVCTVGQINLWTFANLNFFHVRSCRCTTTGEHCAVAVNLGRKNTVSELCWLTAVHRLPRQSASSPWVSMDSNTRWLVKSVGRERGGEGGSNSPEKLPVFPSGSLSPGNEISIAKSNYCLLLLWDF